MNKAFCKEPEQSGRPLCPRCGAEGQVVTEATLRAHVSAGDAETLAVDVSSGIEADVPGGGTLKGIKDPEKIHQFVAAVRAADQRLAGIV